MKAYHYTSIENWKKIKKNGLKRYWIRDIRDVDHNTPMGSVHGIWFFLHPQKGIGNAAFVIYTALKHPTDEVVLIEVDLKEDEIYPKRFNHEGTLMNLRYHNRKEDQEAIIALEDITPDRIKKIGSKNLVKLLEMIK